MRHAADHPIVERSISNAGRTQMQEQPALRVIDAAASAETRIDEAGQTGRHASRFFE
ncbi:MAG TPA: hypothetical protein VGO72_02370 [Herminiimonas sp.]|nr:hypothetical protein [Herminiimonas sp.]